MQYFSVVAVLDGETYLCEQVEHLVLREVLNCTSGLRLSLVLVLDLGLKVAIVRIVHHDAQLAFLGFINFSETNNIWVL